MSRSAGSPRPLPLSNRPGVAGALSRFWQRSYASDYLALGFLTAGWVLVSVTPYELVFSMFKLLLSENELKANNNIYRSR